MIASGATYNLNGQMLTATIQGAAHAWQYNDRGQLTRETAGSLMDFEYTFSATENDGRVARRKDYISGEDVQFQYDALGRLSSATATGAGVAWSQSFTHDGFGNLTQRSGSGTLLSVAVNEKNQVTGVSYDANGNQTSIGSHALGYDAENRLRTVNNISVPDYYPGTETHGYSVKGERLLVELYAQSPNPHYTPDWKKQELRFYDTNSQLLAVFDVVCAAPCTTSNDPYYPVEKTDKKRVYFAGKLVQVGTQAAVTDRLGSLIAHGSTRYRYYPYGEAIGTQEWDKPQFATYTRDGSSGLDDAMNRQYDRIWGRFTSPDPYQASGGPADPGSWNRYAYVLGDPINYHDRLGLMAEPSTSCGIDSTSPLCAIDDPTISSGLGEPYPQTTSSGGAPSPPQFVPLDPQRVQTLANDLANIPGYLLGSKLANDYCYRYVIKPLEGDLGFDLGKFVTFLHYGGTFLDGTRSTATVATNVLPKAGADIQFGVGATVNGVFNSGPIGTRTDALTSATTSTFTVYFRPSAVSVASGANLSILFHEALHGFIGYLGGGNFFDDDLQKAFFGPDSSLVGQASRNITEHIRSYCFK